MSYQREDPAAFLDAQGWAFKRQGQELVTACPFCDKPNHLYMHQETGVWKCHRCGEGGNLYQLRKRLGLDNGNLQSLAQALGAKPKRIPRERVEAMHAALLKDTEALAYATETRRWSLEVVKRFKVGLRVDGCGKWLAYPWWRRGECVGMKYRILPAYESAHPQRFEREAGCESILFNVDTLAGHEEIILASGESDALSLLTLGFENVVATPTGETSLPASAVDALTKKARVLTPFDNDTTGQKGAREIGRRIGFDRTWLVPLPGGAKDVNDYLVQGGTREDFQRLLEAAVQFDIPSVFSLGQALDRLEEEKSFGGWDWLSEMTPWPSVNRRVGMWRPGNLIVVSGPQGTGKTTWALNAAAFWAAKGFPALVYCLEMSVEELVQHVLSAHYQLIEEEVTPAVIAQARQELAEWPLYIGANPRVTGRKEVLDLLTQAIRRYGLRLLVFDNLHMLARSIEHRNEEIGVLTKGFKLLAMELEIPLVLVAQPRKLQPGQVMTCWDLKDSVDIFSDADQIILLHRELVGATRDGEAVAAAQNGESDNLSPRTLVRVAKARHMASRDALLHFEGAQHRFREIEPGESSAAGAKPNTAPQVK
jgi:KaiC/GvpD/RAD55 family RecA-like ATPase